MSARRGSWSDAVPPWSLALVSMFSVQLGSALSVPVMDTVGPAGVAWLRLTLGALIVFALARPPVRELRRSDIVPIAGLGVATGVVTMCFLAAIERIPLGVAVSVEFLGPLTVAAVRSHSRRALVWPALALVGVVLLTEPWRGTVDGVGLAFAVAAAVGWGSYIVFTQRVGDRFRGIDGLALALPVAALTAAVAGVPQAIGAVDGRVLLIVLGLALLLPVIPFSLEMLALRRMTHTAFGTLMALEPAIGVLLGVVVLQQSPASWQVLGILLVVLAGAAAQRGGRRSPPGQESSLAMAPDLVGEG